MVPGWLKIIFSLEDAKQIEPWPCAWKKNPISCFFVDLISFQKGISQKNKTKQNKKTKSKVGFYMWPVSICIQTRVYIIKWSDEMFHVFIRRENSQTE